MPLRERYLWVCTNERMPNDPKGSCARRASPAILDQLKEQVAARGLRGRVRVCSSSCLDFCSVGPTIALMPDRVFYGGVTEADIPDIVDSLERGTIVERLRIAPDRKDRRP